MFKGLFSRARGVTSSHAPAKRPTVMNASELKNSMERKEKAAMEREMSTKELETCRSETFRHLDRITRWEIVNSITHTAPAKG